MPGTVRGRGGFIGPGPKTDSNLIVQSVLVNDISSGTRETIARGAVWAIVAANALWAVASVGMLVSGLVAPTILGYAFVIAQAAVVALLGELQYAGLKRPVVAA